MDGVIEYLSQTPLWTLRTQSLDVFLVLVFFWFYGFLKTAANWSKLCTVGSREQRGAGRYGHWGKQH